MISLDRAQPEASTGHRIGRDEALKLLTGNDLLALGLIADKIRRFMHPENRVTFVIDRNVNYTNICETKCSFCAFFRDKTAPDAYVLEQDAIFEKIDELVMQGGTQLLMQGGLNPKPFPLAGRSGMHCYQFRPVA
jgi:cyclic dehypoxanthinyl futalosine synthase